MEPHTPQAPADGRAANSARSRQRLLDAAIVEFAEHGYAGARVAAIADRAGVNKQLISYHFGGKRGLYEQLHVRWLQQERDLRRDDPSLPELVARYFDLAVANPNFMRLAARQALDGSFPAGSDDRADLEDLQRRQRDGQLAADLDPAAVLLAIMGMVNAPILFGDAAGQLIGGDHRHYAEQLVRILRHLAGPASAGDGGG